MKIKSLHASILALSLAALLAGCSQAPANFQKQLQEQLIKAKPGDVIALPEGKFQLDRTLSLTADKVTIRGQGMGKSILSFAGQKEGGSGLLVKANDFTIEDVAIEDTAGDGLTIQGGNNITVRRVRVEWTRGPNSTNGPYAIYPTECKNVLVEDSVAKGASDAGFYIGQSDYVIMRRNRAEYNVDGYEVENSQHVDVYDNVATHNTGGLGVFNLPDLPKQGGKYVRVFRNQILENNTANFAPKSLGAIYHLPAGTGMYVMAINNVEVFENKIRDNNTTNVYVIEYNPSLGEIKDVRYRPFTEQVYLHDNEISGGGKSPDNRLDDVKALSAALGGTLPDVIYDGVVDPKILATKKGANPGQICLTNNSGGFTFVNFMAQANSRILIRDAKAYKCSLPALEAVTIPQVPSTSSPAQGSGQ